MKFEWTEAWAESLDGKDAKGRVLTLQVGRFVFALWFTRVEK